MPRNRYTRFIRISEDAQAERQIEELAVLALSFSRKDTDVFSTQNAADDKERHRIRREQNRRHKSERFRGANQP